jgi:diaminopimelate decarboxylase
MPITHAITLHQNKELIHYMSAPFLSPSFSYHDNALYAEGAPIHDIVKTVKTPFYLYSAAQIKENIAQLQSALRSVMPVDRFTICYACKALNNVAIMRLIGQQGCGADIVSSGELTRASQAAIPHEKIVFSGVGKSDEEIEHALNASIRQINVESGAEMKLIETVAQRLGKKAPIVFRLNPDVKAGAHEKISTGQKENKFGLEASAIKNLYEYAEESAYLQPRGISLHIGSQLIDMSPFDTAYQIAAAFIGELRSAGHSPDTIDLGGGIGIIYDHEDKPDLSHYAALVAKHIVPLGLHMIFEPGRMIVGDAGLLISKVMYIKETDHKSFLVLDAAMNDLLRPALYDSAHPIIPINQDGGDTVAPFDVVGPVCESADIFGKDIALPEHIQANDYVAITGAGAYGATMSSSYNARDITAEVLVSRTRFDIIRRPINIHDQLGFEDIPDYLISG